MSTPNAPTRGRGRPPRVTRAMIIAAARKIEPASLTMQAIADELGVDRKTIHYHVPDRDQLLQLLAADSFQTELGRADVDDAAGWQDAIRDFATMVRDASLVAGALTTHYSVMDRDLHRAALAPAETALRALLRDGFDETTASHLLRNAGILGAAYAREVETDRRQGQRRHRDVVGSALTAQDPGELGALRHLIVAMPDVGTEAAFQYALDLLVAGAQALRDAAHD